MARKKYIIGIDEVGRGPLAGPIAVCAFKMPVGFSTKKFGPLRDSKKLSAERREEISHELEILKKQGIVDYAVCYESAPRIDKLGVTKVINNCIEQALKKIKANPAECRVLLDGGLKAPAEFLDQKTIIKGDEKERAIAFASIAAKVSRDARMTRLAKKYPHYGFEIHKGYGTKKHSENIEKYGLSAEHRRLFCRRFC